jgi:hypothetical protein
MLNKTQRKKDGRKRLTKDGGVGGTLPGLVNGSNLCWGKRAKRAAGLVALLAEVTRPSDALVLTGAKVLRIAADASANSARS